MVAVAALAPLKKNLVRIGYAESWFHEDLPLANGGTVPLVAFSGQPFDARTACVSAATANGADDDSMVETLRSAAAPVSIIARGDRYDVWRHEEKKPRYLDRIDSRQLENYFERNRKELAPSAVYRAKVWGRFESRQLAFVDAGLLPLIESEVGASITALIVELVQNVQSSLRWKAPTEEQGKWLLKSVFWLLAAKILQDKRVERFIRLELQDVEMVFERVAQHYRSPTTRGNDRPLGQDRRAALEVAARRIATFTNLRLLSTESLGYVYESALVDKATRQSLGTHSTPAWMVDYMIGRIRDRVEAMSVADRRVFEPACGHAGFLIGGLRLLSELRPADYHEDRKSYLRQRLRGIEVDSFAMEIARLSLTLADVPNPNGWALENADMFEGDTLEKEAARATIVLSNPPFEKFGADERGADWQYGKASETLRRVAMHLPKGGVLGFIVPHNFLVSAQDSSLRRLLTKQYEIVEISVFADRVFRCGAPESAILIAQRRETVNKVQTLYQRVRESQIDDFKHTYRPSSADTVEQSVLESGESTFFVPELLSVWRELSSLRRLGDHDVSIGKGLEHKGRGSLPESTITESDTERAKFVRGFVGWSEGVMIHGLPREKWLNIDDAVIRRPLSGTLTGRSQILVNYGRVSRGPWCLKALIDDDGHAVTSRFLVVRPNENSFSLPVLWALLNSPIANAFMHTHSSKRDMLGMTLENLPVPEFDSSACRALEQAVGRYLVAARTFVPKPAPQTDLFTREASAPTAPTQPEDLRNLMWSIDAQVLRLYALRAESEQRLLHMFAGAARGGVPFEQHEYFPSHYTSLSRLADLLRIVGDWDAITEAKKVLVDKKLARNATEQELLELKELQRLTSARRDLYAPLPLAGLERVQADLERKGLWRN